jgi:2-hydroxy-3-keto-5-methylthiopentenyl-1-phosphate phosphatase
MKAMSTPAARVLVTDFDGTITKYDFYELITTQLLPPETPNYWAEYRTGQITHFEALRGYFAAIRADESAVWRIVDRMEIDSNLAAAVKKLRQASWKVVIASAGCQWYIERLLSQTGRVDVEVHANPGRFQAGQGLLMELPRESPFFSPTHGIDKAGVVRQHLAAGSTVAFAGDGFPDVDPARLVPPDLRFAHGDLADVLTKSGQSFRHFNDWSEIAQTLIEAPT